MIGNLKLKMHQDALSIKRIFFTEMDRFHLTKWVNSVSSECLVCLGKKIFTNIMYFYLFGGYVY